VGRLEGDRLVGTLVKSKFAIIAVTSVLVLCVTSQIALVAADSGYQDEFMSSPDLQTGWSFTNPAGTGSISLSTNPGYLTITATQNSRMGPTGSSNQNAPRVLQSVTGDFVATTYITALFTSDNYRGGLILYYDVTHFIVLEKWGSGLVKMYQLSGTSESLPLVASTGNSVYLKLVKTGSTVTGYCGADESATTQVASFTFNYNSVNIGLITFNGDSPTPATSFSAKFDFFHITPHLSLTSALPEYPVGVFGAAAAIAGAYVFFKAKDRVKPAFHL
jgi:hypothetical protein